MDKILIIILLSIVFIATLTRSTFGFGMLTIASQTLKAANTNPAQSLRYE